MNPVLPSTENTAADSVPARFPTLQEWLSWQQKLHFTSIDLGLERCTGVARELGLLSPDYRIITIAGTNGKGSCAMMLDMIMRRAGYRSGCYTSPHLHRYNERIRVDGLEVSDDKLCSSFSRIDQARHDVSLTYFEFGTLAALDIFQHSQLDVAILEVGLGGRLDAVNMLDADVALLCTIDIDHVRWLGQDRNAIGHEKAGIFRPRRPAVCADPDPPESVMRHAAAIGTELYVSGRDFFYEINGDSWSWHSRGRSLHDLPRPDPYNDRQVQNAAAVLMVLELLQRDFPMAQEILRGALAAFQAPGRCQVVNDEIPVVFDVAHNPQAVANLKNCLEKMPPVKSTHMVVGFLNDKDYAQMLQLLSGRAEYWYLVSLEDERRLDAKVLMEHLTGPGLTGKVSVFDSVAQAMSSARTRAVRGDRIVVTGSFITVGAAMSWLRAGH